MSGVEILYDILTKDELDYINDLISDKTKWKWRTDYDQVNEFGSKVFYDSIWPDYEKLKNYHNRICDNGKYFVKETAINIIQKDRQYKNSFHTDTADLSYATYFNENFKGGRLFYYDKNNDRFIIEPKKNLTVKINIGVPHAVEEVTDGIRFSLYSFLGYKPKNKKTIL